ncbi:DNA adenine methylase [Coprobacter sp.]
METKRSDKQTRNVRSCDKVRPFLRYPGSKYNASKYIEPFWRNIQIEEYREPFLGSGAIFFKKPVSDFSILNDIDEELINCYRIIKNKDYLDGFIEDIKNIKPDKIWFEKLKKMEVKSDYERALRYFLINRTAYSGIMNSPNWGFHPVKSVQPDKWPERIMKASEKLQLNVQIESLHFSEIIQKESDKNVWLFLDPPYFSADQKRAYAKSFVLKDHFDLHDILKNTPFKFCLTYDNCDEIKELYSWANIHEIEWMYHTANSNVTQRKKGKELIITNY